MQVRDGAWSSAEHSGRGKAWRALRRRLECWGTMSKAKVEREWGQDMQRRVGFIGCTVVTSVRGGNHGRDWA